MYIPHIIFHKSQTFVECPNKHPFNCKTNILLQEKRWLGGDESASCLRTSYKPMPVFQFVLTFQIQQVTGFCNSCCNSMAVSFRIM